MHSDVIEFIDRQFAFAQTHTGRAFFFQLETLLVALDAEPRIRVHLEDLDVEATRSLKKHRAACRRIVRTLRALRDDVVAQGMTDDDRDPPDEEAALPNARPSPLTMRTFEFHLDQQAPRFPFNVAEDLALPTSAPLEILRGRLEDASREPKLDREAVASAIGRRADVRDQHEHVVVDFARDGLLLPGVCLARLRGGATAARRLHGVGATELELRGVVGPLLDVGPSTGRLVAVIREVALSNAPGGNEILSFNLDLDRLRAELRRRIGTTRSHRALVGRFRDRAQWYDRTELREMALAQRAPSRAAAARKPATGTASKKSPRPIEDRLVAVLARSLFDAGLDVLTTPLAGMLRPDLLGMPNGKKWPLYIEGKQYTALDRGYLIRGYWQMIDTMHSLIGTAELHEAFYVVFRLGGAMVHLPPEMRLDDINVYSVVIDISDPKMGGSRQTAKPVKITADDVIEAKPSAAAAKKKPAAKKTS